MIIVLKQVILTLQCYRPGSRIRLHMKDFETECGWDHLYIWDGDHIFDGLQVMIDIIKVEIS